MIINPRAKSWISEDVKRRCFEVDPATIGHHLHFGFMDPIIKSILKDIKIVGQAFTVKTTANDSVMVHKAVSMAEEGDVIVIDRTGDRKHACVGEMVAYAAKVKKIAGIIVDGPSTDIQAIREIGLPIFSTGLSPITTKLVGNSGEINTPVNCGGVIVSPGDLIIADDNGVLVLFKNETLDLDMILKIAENSEKTEPETKKLLDKGIALASITKTDEILRQKGLID